MQKLMALLAFCVVAHATTAYQCTITGEVRNRTSKHVVLHRCSESSKTLYENPVLIPIVNGKFSYMFSYDQPEAYELVFQDELEVGAWRPIVFFPDTHVELLLFPKDKADNNVVKGGTLNAECTAYQAKSLELFETKFKELDKIRETLQREGSYESEEYNAVLKELRSLKQDDYDARVPIYQKMDEMEKTRSRYTDKGIKLVINRQDSLKRAMFDWKYEYMLNNPTLLSYYLLFKDAVMEVKNDAYVANLAIKSFPTFEKRYPDHVYTGKISSQLSGIQTIVVGNRYVDFKAPTLTGDTLQLSTLISNKVALIDLWGSWCGPCIAKSRSVVPIYQKYKGKGFEIVGIAREFKSTDAVKRRLAKEQFGWTNLVELDDKQNIWNKYGISNGSGLMVLVDRAGTILAIDPKPEELEKILQEKL